MTDVISKAVPTTQMIADEFGVMTKNSPITRRKAISSLARKHGLAPNIVYEMLEAAKKSG
jgi:transposase-like protein